MIIDPLVDRLCRALSRESTLDVRAILLHGSKISSGMVDTWSDTDLIIILNKDQAIISTIIDAAIGTLGPILARETHLETGKEVRRYVVETDKRIEQVDLSIYRFDYWTQSDNIPEMEYELLYGSLPEGSNIQNPPKNPVQYPESSIDATWFRYFQCVKKFMRGDNLIGSHLMMGLIQENLVLEMIERDERKQTNIHRFGDYEPMPWLDKLANIDSKNREQVLNYLQGLSQYYDDGLLARFPDYESRHAAFQRFIALRH